MTTAVAPKAQGATMTQERTIVRINKDLIKQIKLRAVQEDKSIIQWVDEALHKALRDSKERKK